MGPEIVVLKAFLTASVEYFGKRFRGSHIDQTYNPFEPTTDELLRDDYDVAQRRRFDLFSEREDTVRDIWPEAALCYSHWWKQRQMLLWHEGRDVPFTKECKME